MKKIKSIVRSKINVTKNKNQTLNDKLYGKYKR